MPELHFNSFSDGHWIMVSNIIRTVPPEKRKKIQAYLDVMADGNLAYKYNERAYEQYRDKLEKGLEEMRNDPEFEEYNKNNPW
jgi:hypothetical protein